MIAPHRSHSGAAVLVLALLLGGSIGAGWAQSDTAETPSDQPATTPPPKKSWETPFLSTTNAVSSPFLSQPALPISRPEEAQLSLHDGAPPPDPSTAITGLPGSPSSRFVFPEGRPDELPKHLLVVYNASDPDSQALAQYYASRREIPPERVLGIACSTGEDITRAQYNETVREPIISYIFSQHWMTRQAVSVPFAGQTRDLLLATRNEIWAIVLMRGIPLRILPDASLSGTMENNSSLGTNAACVDSELSLLPIFGLPLGGFVPNIFFDEVGTGLMHAGSELATRLIFVTRLDGPRPADVRRMIDDSLYAEENRLAGLAVIDTRGITDPANAYVSGDDWLRNSRDLLAKNGWTVYSDDKADVLPGSDPLNHVAIYLGWYHEGAIGPWITGPNRFARGAIAYHLHSFSAVTVRNPSAAWVGPLIAHGAAATMGCVFEPYLDFTPHLDIFTRRLLAGDSFGEAAYACQKGLSWMTTVVGDPLYRPFRKSVDSVLAESDATSGDHYDWLLLQQVRRGIARQQIPRNTASFQHYLDVPGAVAQEGLGDLLGTLNGAANGEARMAAYREAETLAVQPIDHIRIGLKLVDLDEKRSRIGEAREELRALRETYPIESALFLPAPLTAPGSNPEQLTLHPVSAPKNTLSLPKPPRPPKPDNASTP